MDTMVVESAGIVKGSSEKQQEAVTPMAGGGRVTRHDRQLESRVQNRFVNRFCVAPRTVADFQKCSKKFREKHICKRVRHNLKLYTL